VRYEITIVSLVTLQAVPIGIWPLPNDQQSGSTVLQLILSKLPDKWSREPPIEWVYYPRIAPGQYLAYCKVAKQYYDRAFKRHVCILRFDILSDSGKLIACVPMWLNLGGGEKPRAKRRSRYFSEWVRAKGEPPARCDRLSPQVFTKRIARVEVGDTEGRAPYSVVRKILVWETGAPVGSISTSVKQSRRARLRPSAVTD